MKARVLTGLLVLGIAGGGYWAWSQGGAPPPVAAPKGPPAIPVVVRSAEIRAVPERFSTIGAAAPIASIAVKSRIDSVVAAIHFVEGQEIKAGELLFTLDDRVLRAQLAQAEANLERDRAQLEKAKGDVRRYAELVRRDAVARQQFDAAAATAAALEATVKADQAAVDSARVALGYTRLYAPMDGRTGAVTARPGASVRPADSAPLVTLTQLRPINVAFNIPESRLDAVRRAMAAGPVTVRTTASGGGASGSGAPSEEPPEEGVLTFIDSQVDPLSGTILAKAEFSNERTRLWPGQFVDVSVVLRVDADAVTVPTEAVLSGQDGNFVFVVSDRDTAEVRKVTITRTDAGLAVIGQGLAAGERVVADGQSRLVPGAAVSVRGADGQGSGGGPGGGPGGGKTPGTGS